MSTKATPEGKERDAFMECAATAKRHAGLLKKAESPYAASFKKLAILYSTLAPPLNPADGEATSSEAGSPVSA